jgi:deoxyribose-phosphate aldolase
VGREAELEAEIRGRPDAVPAPRILKVIIESAALTDEEIVMACRACEAAGADFVKTSTGFHRPAEPPSTPSQLMRETVGDPASASRHPAGSAMRPPPSR